MPKAWLVGEIFLIYLQDFSQATASLWVKQKVRDFILQPDYRPKVLLIEGKRNNEYAFSLSLARKKYELMVVTSGTEGIRILDQFEPDIVIINAASLRTNGQRITSRFRNRLPKIPIILILNGDESQTDSPEANFTLRLPFTVQKLVNHMNVYLNNQKKNTLVIGPLRLNTLTNLVTCHGKETVLTPRLTELLRYLIEHKGKLVKRSQLFSKVWDTDYTEDTRTLDVHISWLRQAIEKDPRDPQIITTERAVGYKLNL